MQTPIEAVLADRIKSKLSFLSVKLLKRSYLQEARYLLRKWPEFREPRHDLVAWAMAKDFSQRFARHSFHEWAYVFGIPKTHTLLSFPLHPRRVEISRKVSVVGSSVQTAVLYAIVFILFYYAVR